MNASTQPLVIVDPNILGLAAALCVGLMIGAERERRKGEGPSRGVAGVRTFAMAALLGALARIEGGDTGLIVASAAAAALAVASYLRTQTDDPGLTTETAFVLTVLLGGLAADRPALAVGLGVTVAALLAARSPLHRFIDTLSEEELRDGLTLAVVTFVIWPLLPDQAIGPYGALNLHAIWLVVILVMAVGAAGHAATRLVGARFGLPIVGLASGFVSSALTIAAMGARAAGNSELLAAATAGAVLSTIATIVQIAILLFTVDAAVLRVMMWPLLCAGAMAVLYAAFFVATALRAPRVEQEKSGRAFSLQSALSFAAVLCVVLVGSAALSHYFGANGAIIAAGLAGFADVHTAAISTATLVVEGKLALANAAVPILVALSTNTITKALLAMASGERRFVARVAPGLALVAASAWLGLLVPLPAR